jgi:hypothetical protein
MSHQQCLRQRQLKMVCLMQEGEKLPVYPCNGMSSKKYGGAKGKKSGVSMWVGISQLTFISSVYPLCTINDQPIREAVHGKFSFHLALEY